ncbi:MAG: PKD domain-containing protein, partial [Betaproteobacteria bacterium]
MNTHARRIYWLLLAALPWALVGCGGGSGACSGAALGSLGSQVCGSGASNQVPVAAVAGPTTAALQSAVSLDGSGSRDPDGQTLSYRWELSSKPTGSTATLSDATVARPVITPDVQGTYTVRLIVHDGKADS